MFISRKNCSSYDAFVFSVQRESQLLPCCPPFYESKMQEQGVEDIVNRNKINFKPYCDVVDQDFSQFNENSISNQEPHSQIKNETPEVEYLNENYLEDRKKKLYATNITRL